MSKKEQFSDLLGQDEPTGAKQKSNLVSGFLSPDSASGNDDVNKNGDVNENVNVNVYPPRVSRRPKFEDTHTRSTFYIENGLLEQINRLSDGEKGEKTRIINDALRQYLKRK